MREYEPHRPTPTPTPKTSRKLRSFQCCVFQLILSPTHRLLSIGRHPHFASRPQRKSQRRQAHSPAISTSHDSTNPLILIHLTQEPERTEPVPEPKPWDPPSKSTSLSWTSASKNGLPTKLLPPAQEELRDFMSGLQLESYLPALESQAIFTVKVTFTSMSNRSS